VGEVCGDQLIDHLHLARGLEFVHKTPDQSLVILQHASLRSVQGSARRVVL